MKRVGIGVTLALATALLLSGCASAPKVSGIFSVAALGDSISVASASCGLQEQCLENSWSTGTNAAVNSQATRISTDEGVSISTYNDAVAGSKVGDLAIQVQAAISQKPSYVTILIGANDYCTPTTAQMTSPSVFSSTFSEALEELASSLPTTKILVDSVPNPNSLWNAGKGSLAATTVWSAASICQSLLASPNDTSAAGNQRRQQVEDAANSYNTALQTACNGYANCHYDNGAVFSYNFSLDDLSNVDYFHPSVQGQAKLSDLAWNKGGMAAFLASK